MEILDKNARQFRSKLAYFAEAFDSQCFNKENKPDMSQKFSFTPDISHILKMSKNYL